MDFIQFEAIDKSQQNEQLDFSDDEKTNDEDDFIGNSKQPMEDVIFYKKLDPENIDHYNKFPNQTRDPRVAVYKDDEIFFGTEDTQPEFDTFNGFEKSVKKFKDTLKFENIGNLFLIQQCMV